MTLSFLLLIFLAIGGLVIGSFLNVVIYRLPLMLQTTWRMACESLLLPPKVHTGKQPVFNLFLPRSLCTHCKKNIPFWHNIPILSFLLLRGRCCFCHAKISLQYPLVEGACSLLFLSAGLYFDFNLTLMFALFFIGFVICLTVIDLQHQLLPDSLTLGLLWVGLLANTQDLFAPLPDAIFGAISGYITLWVITQLFYSLTGKVGMGNGDFKLLAAFGGWFGWTVLPLILLFSSFVGATMGLIYLKKTKQSKDTPIPFGPFLCLSGLLALFLGN